MAINLPPVVKTSKRTIPGTRVFDSAHVFADYNPETSKACYDSHYRSTFNCTANKVRSYDIHRAGKINKPDPTHVHFLYDNTRFTNEPICNAATEITRKKQHQWWPEERPNESRPKPSYSCDSSSRSDFRTIELSKRPRGLTRFSCIEGKRNAALGIVPVTQLPANHVKTERISYIHQYDARQNMRERGKLHGSFVWDTTNRTEQELHRRFVRRMFPNKDISSFDEPTSARKISERRTNIQNSVGNNESGNSNSQGSKVLISQLSKPKEVQGSPNKLELPSSEVHQNKGQYSGHMNSPPPHLC